MQSNHVHLAASDGIRQGPNGPSPNGHAPESPSTAPGTGWTATPNALLDIYGLLSSSERDALTYIVRRTLGFEGKHDGDAIPYNQFLHGTRSAVDGHMLDYGCGIKSSATLHKALASLEQRGLIAVTHPPRATKKALIPTATYRVILPPPTLEIEAAAGLAAGPATLEIEAAPLQLLKRSTLETEAVHFRNQSGATLEIEASIERGKIGRKDREKESGKESSSAGACAPRTEPPARASHPLAGDTSSSKEAGGPREAQLAFTEDLVHGPRMAPPAPHHPAGETSPNGPAAGPPPDKTPAKTKRVSLELVEGEPVDLAAAKLFFSQVPPGPKGPGWETAQPLMLEQFRKLLAPLLEDLGPEDYGRWVHYMRGEPWLAEDHQRINQIGAPWLAKEVSAWQNLPPEKQNVTKAQLKAEHAALLEAREQDKYRDPRKIDNRIRGAELMPLSCSDCGAKPSTPHYEGCWVVRALVLEHGTLVTEQHCNRRWVMDESQKQREG